MSKLQQKVLAMVMGVLLLVSMLFVGREAAWYVTGQRVQMENRICVILDPGHGGDDPGKIGIDGSKEKDINLSVAQKVKTYLETAGIEVVMTRETSDGLYDADASNKKVQDMKRRIAKIEEIQPTVAVSIHQNSYPEESIHGAQVFYYDDSAEGEKLAQYIQDQLIEKADPTNTRQIKANDSYYLLKKTKVPIVIVECGFLSNTAEAEKLNTDTYQDRIAWAIYLGIVQYVKE